MTTSNYILHIKNDKGTQASSDLLGDLKGIVSKFDGKVKDDFKLIPGFAFSLPTTVGDSFKNAADSWGTKNGVTVELEKDQQVHTL